MCCSWPCDCGCGVFAPVPMGVERFDGSSEVKIVAEDGEMTYLALRVARRASLKPRRMGSPRQY